MKNMKLFFGLFFLALTVDTSEISKKEIVESKSKEIDSSDINPDQNNEATRLASDIEHTSNAQGSGDDFTGRGSVINIQKQGLSGVSYIIQPDSVPIPAFKPIHKLPKVIRNQNWSPEKFIKDCCSQKSQNIKEPPIQSKDPPKVTTSIPPIHYYPDHLPVDDKLTSALKQIALSMVQPKSDSQLKDGENFEETTTVLPTPINSLSTSTLPTSPSTSASPSKSSSTRTPLPPSTTQKSPEDQEAAKIKRLIENSNQMLFLKDKAFQSQQKDTEEQKEPLIKKTKEHQDDPQGFFARLSKVIFGTMPKRPQPTQKQPKENDDDSELPTQALNSSSASESDVLTTTPSISNATTSSTNSSDDTTPLTSTDGSEPYNAYHDVSGFLKEIASSQGFQNAFLGDLIKNFGNLDHNALKLIYSLLIKPLNERSGDSEADSKEKFKGRDPDGYISGDSYSPHEFPLPFGTYNPFNVLSTELEPSPILDLDDDHWKPLSRSPKSPSISSFDDGKVNIITAPPVHKHEVVVGSSFNPNPHETFPQSFAAENRMGEESPNPPHSPPSFHSLPPNLKLGMKMPPPEALKALPEGSVLIPPSQVMGHPILPKVPQDKSGAQLADGPLSSILPNFPFFGANVEKKTKPKGKKSEPFFGLQSFLSNLFGRDTGKKKRRYRPMPPVRHTSYNDHQLPSHIPPREPAPPRYKLEQILSHADGKPYNRHGDMMPSENLPERRVFSRNGFEGAGSNPILMPMHVTPPSYIITPPAPILFPFLLDDRPRYDENVHADQNSNYHHEVAQEKMAQIHPEHDQIYPPQPDSTADDTNDTLSYSNLYMQEFPKEDDNEYAEYYYMSDDDYHQIKDQNQGDSQNTNLYYNSKYLNSFDSIPLDASEYTIDFSDMESLDDTNETSHDEQLHEDNLNNLITNNLLASQTMVEEKSPFHKGPVDIPEGTLIPQEAFEKALQQQQQKRKFVRPPIEPELPSFPDDDLHITPVSNEIDAETSEPSYPSLANEYEAAVAHLWNNLNPILQSPDSFEKERKINISVFDVKPPHLNESSLPINTHSADTNQMAYILIASCCGLALLAVIGIVVIVRLKKTCGSTKIRTSSRSRLSRAGGSLGNISTLDPDGEGKFGHKLGSWFTGKNEQFGTGKLRSNMTLPEVKDFQRDKMTRKSGSTRDLLSLSSSSSRDSTPRNSQRSAASDPQTNGGGQTSYPNDEFITSLSDPCHSAAVDSEASPRESKSVRRKRTKSFSGRPNQEEPHTSRKGHPSYHYSGEPSFSQREYPVGSMDSEDIESAITRDSVYPTDSEFEDRSRYQTDSKDLESERDFRSMDSRELGDKISLDLKQYQSKERTRGRSHRSYSPSSYTRDNVQSEVFLEFDNMLSQHGQDVAPHSSKAAGEMSQATMDSQSRPSSPDSIDTEVTKKLSINTHQGTPPHMPPKFNPPPPPPRPPKPSRLSPDFLGASPKSNRGRALSPEKGKLRNEDRLV